MDADIQLNITLNIKALCFPIFSRKFSLLILILGAQSHTLQSLKKDEKLIFK